MDFLNALASHTYRIQEPDLENEENPWLNLAARIDCVSGSLLRFCLMQAVKKAAASETEWLKSTAQIQLDDDPDSKLIRILLAARSEPTCGSQQARQDLEEFAVLARDIKNRLAEIE